MAKVYQIRVRGHLDLSYATWFGDFHITHLPDGDSVLTGAVPDQAALYGIVARCRDLGVTLVSIMPLQEAGGACGQDGPERAAQGGNHE
ncbi:MAG: hypothetical protein H3C34_12995 [Caldilineaceae bacterium]|nr:hypothetical protein [Caldilineaceae bacterium]